MFKSARLGLALWLSRVDLFAGWTLTSIAGFSGAFSRVLHRSLVSRATTGRMGLYGSVSSGVTGIVNAPYEGMQ